jgi:hypothetical protein
LSVTAVVTDAELLVVLPSLAFETAADTETKAPGYEEVDTVVVTVMVGRAPPAGTGAGLVHSWLATLQLQPLPETV